MSKQAKNNEGPTLKMIEQKNSITFQTQSLAIQAIFSTPILQLMNYIEQYQKYNYRAALSSINLKVEEFDQYYSLLRQQIEDTYSSLTYKSMDIIHDLIVSLKLAKIQLWQQNAAIAKGLRTHLFLKNLDPYDFQPSKFQQDIKKAISMFDPNKSDSKTSQQMIEELSLKLRETESAKMQAMFSGCVVNPYIAQNSHCMQVNSSGIYASLTDSLRVKMQKFDETNLRNLTSIHQQTLRFSQSFCDQNLHAQNTAYQIIKNYNLAEKQAYKSHSIEPLLHQQGKKQMLDADQLLPGKQMQLESKPVFSNRQVSFSFKGKNRVINQETGQQQMVEPIQQKTPKTQWQQPHIKNLSSKPSPFDVFAKKRGNDMRQFFYHREYKKQRQAEQYQKLRYPQGREKNIEKNVVNHKIVRTIVPSTPWLEMAQQSSPLLWLYQICKKKMKNIWQIRSISSEQRLMHTSFVSSPSLSVFAHKNSISETLKAKNQAQMTAQDKQKANRQEQLYQKQRRQQQQQFLLKNKAKMKNRTYEEYMKMCKMQNKLIGSKVNKEEIYRYGIRISTQFQRNQFKQIDSFMYNYFKQRYYRENQSVSSNADNPIIYMDSDKLNMQAGNKIVSSLVSSISKKVKQLNFFLVWSEDIICFRRQGENVNFQIYCFWDRNNAQRLLYQVKRRLYMNISGFITHDFENIKQNDEIYSKIQVVHRLIYSRHKKIESSEQSISKGKIIASEIVADLASRST